MERQDNPRERRTREERLRLLVSELAAVSGVPEARAREVLLDAMKALGDDLNLKALAEALTKAPEKGQGS